MRRHPDRARLAALMAAMLLMFILIIILPGDPYRIGAASSAAVAFATLLLAWFTWQSVQQSREQMRAMRRPVLVPISAPPRDAPHSREFAIEIRNVGCGLALAVWAVWMPRRASAQAGLPRQYSAAHPFPIPPGEAASVRLEKGGTLFAEEDRIGEEPLAVPAGEPGPETIDPSERRPRRIGRLTLTWRDVFGLKHAGTFDLDLQGRWIAERIQEKIPKDLSDLDQEKGERIREDQQARPDPFSNPQSGSKIGAFIRNNWLSVIPILISILTYWTVNKKQTDLQATVAALEARQTDLQATVAAVEARAVALEAAKIQPDLRIYAVTGELEPKQIEQAGLKGVRWVRQPPISGVGFPGSATPTPSFWNKDLPFHPFGPTPTPIPLPIPTVQGPASPIYVILANRGLGQALDPSLYVYVMFPLPTPSLPLKSFDQRTPGILWRWGPLDPLDPGVAYAFLIPEDLIPENPFVSCRYRDLENQPHDCEPKRLSELIALYFINLPP